MIEQDTIKLLRECDAGIKMGVSSIDDVLDKAQCQGLRDCLKSCKDKHVTLQNEIEGMLTDYHDDGKEPNMMAKNMSHMKTAIKTSFDESDNTIADLITDGCNMGVKSLSRYLNKYAAADESSKDITKRLINLEERLAVDMRQYL